MRRTLLVPMAVLVLLATTMSGAPAGAADVGDHTVRPRIPAASAPVEPTPREALDRAVTVLHEPRDQPRQEAASRPDATVSLRDLYASLPRLVGADRRRAESLLARPTQGRNDPYGDGYDSRAVARCSRRLCVHRVKRTSDRATAAWARRTLRVLGRVWKKEVVRMGYRRPLGDGRRGGNAKLDVYLADVGSRGLFGYCAPEYTAPGNRRLASGYCVLDNDFARSQFGTRPLVSLKVTAAHEFFHAVQFAYDYLEDPWLMEATATWMEERFADEADDNRRYLRFGQVTRPWLPLDLYQDRGSAQYGNWAFFEYLSLRFGNRIVRRTWNQAGEADHDGNLWSTRALQAALPRRTSFKRVHADFLADNVVPAHTYPEGDHWPTPRLLPDTSFSLGADGVRRASVSIDHMAGLDFRTTPGAGLDDTGWRLRVSVDGPPRQTSPTATLVRIIADGAVKRVRVRLDRAGDGTASVPFDQGGTTAVWVVVDNASTRFDCRGAYRVGFSCGGTARDDDQPFGLTFETNRAG